MWPRRERVRLALARKAYAPASTRPIRDPLLDQCQGLGSRRIDDEADAGGEHVHLRGTRTQGLAQQREVLLGALIGSGRPQRRGHAVGLAVVIGVGYAIGWRRHSGLASFLAIGLLLLLRFRYSSH